MAPIPSCVLMFKQELPLMFPDDADIATIKRIFRSVRIPGGPAQGGLLRTDFARPLGKIAYQVACHLRVQNIGLKTRDILQLIPGTTVEPIERCSGHNGTYGVKRESRDTSMKIGKPVMQRVRRAARITMPAIVRWRDIRSKAAWRRAAADSSIDAAPNGIRD